MKTKVIALAIATLATGAVNAADIHLTGASAIRNNTFAAVKKLCSDALPINTNVVHVYSSGTSLSSPANEMVYVCRNAANTADVAMGGTAIHRVIHTTTGGSLNSILGMSSAVAKQQIPLNTALTGCLPSAAGSALFLGSPVYRSCPLGSPLVSQGGFSDVEYAPVIEQVVGLDAVADGFVLADVQQGNTNVAQAFGVGVSDSLYKALQAAQITAGTIPATCASGDPTPLCQPTVGRSQVVALIDNNEFNGEKNGVLPFGLTQPAGTVVEYARRVTTSGTQSSAQIYFLGAGCLNGPNFGSLDIVGGSTDTTGTTVVSASYQYSVNSSTGNVTAKLANNAANFWGFGVVSAENSAPGTAATAGWRFVKLNGAHIADQVLNKGNAVVGRYDFVFEPVSYKATGKTSADQGTFIDAVASKFALKLADQGATTRGLYILPENPQAYAADGVEVSRFQRGGNTPNSCKVINSPL